MSAAAQFDRERAALVGVCPHRSNPPLIAVFFAEQCELALGDLAVRGQQAGPNGTVCPNAPVYLRLDGSDVFLVQRPWGAEIETQPVGRDKRALLGNVFAKPPP